LHALPAFHPSVKFFFTQSKGVIVPELTSITLILLILNYANVS